MNSLLLLIAAVTAAPKPDAAALEHFEKKIRPMLVKHCYECHSAESKIVQANLYLDTRAGVVRGGDSGPAVVPGKPDESLLLAALKYDGYEMPPQGRLSDEVIADFTKWIAAGAADPRDGKAPALRTIDLAEGRKFWSYQPVQVTPPPAVRDAAWPHSEIDRFVLARLEAANLAPVGDASRERLLRRLTLDLIGLPPTPEELDAFAADDAPGAVERVVDRLLASPHFGERWGRHWLDVARYGESSGLERNVPYRMAWRYRDYVIDAFNADMPFDQFIVEQIAGDQLESNTTADRDRQLIATGFLAIGTRALTERVEEKFLLDVADEQLDTVTRAFLASTVACARCHDHKFDPIPTTDYYALAGIFRSTESLPGVRSLRREFSYLHAAPLGDEAERNGRCRQLAERIEKLQKELDAANNDLRTANKTKDPAKIEAAKQQLASATEQIAAARAEAESAGGPRFAMAVRDRAEPADLAVRIRGDVDSLGNMVPRGFLSVVQTKAASTVRQTQQSGRLELARWIAARDNPLTARVAVNRIWQHLFGRGLVDSVDNFGTTGDKPSHPELLDYLATRFVDGGWSVKRTIRDIVLSRTYQLSDERSDAAYGSDPDNRLLWRFQRRRLEAEPIRDALLFVAGTLDTHRPYGSASLTVNNLELGSTAKLLAANDSPRYRSAYLPMLRSNVPEMLSLFDMADPSLVVGRREVTSVPTQALYLMNSKFVQEQARRFAERLQQLEPKDAAARVDAAYRLALSRRPTEAEREQVLQFIAAERAAKRSTADAWIGVCQSLYGCAEFSYVR
jgi:hypothetical protein